MIRAYDRAVFLAEHATCDFPRETVSVAYQCAAGPKPSAMYYPCEENPRIQIHRPNWVDPGDYRAVDVASDAPDPLAELVIFAHELGHHQLVLRGLGTGIFEPDRPLETYREEVGAWIIGRRLLQARHFDDWDFFDEDERTSLAGYRHGLKVMDPGHVESQMRELLNAG
jgi:hypothetical protein